MKLITVNSILLYLVFFLLNTFAINAQTLSPDIESPSGGFSVVMQISMALLLTLLTVFVITLVARYVRELSGDTINQIEDSDH